ncbi:PQQ-binding-like beta-propeller repeat protein [Streptomyces sp. NPDC046716]|uniref:PQQ-binding-like beta-propeller repeat protein n=1 Tax=Streptomyces sp. NPDC046716 TaxID=3157093 RepID=UPI0033FED124
MPAEHGATGGTTSRRRALRLAGGGLALAALGAGAAGCRDGGAEGEGSADSATPRGKGTGSPAASPADGRTPAALWTRSTSAQTYGNRDELVVTGGVVMATGRPLTALDATTGKERWSLPGGAVPGAPLLLGNGTLYLASGAYDGTVGGYDPASGKETWRGHLGKEYRQPRPIAVDDGQVYVIAEILEDDGSSRTNVIAALNSSTGRVVWKEKRDLGTQENGIHAAVQGRHLVYTDFRQNLTVRDTATGRQTWTHKTTKTNYGAFVVHRNLVIVPQGRTLQAFDLADGAEKWSLRTGEFDTFKEPAVLGDDLFIADSGRTLRSVEPRTGKENWRSTGLADAKAQTPHQFVRVGDTLYGATDLDQQGGIHAFDTATGALRWTFNDGSGDHHAWLVATDGTRVLALHGKKLHALPG